MNAVAIIYVNEHLEGLRAEAQRNRAASLATETSLRQRIANASDSLRRTLGIGSTGPVLPQLRDYPYGG